MEDHLLFRSLSGRTSEEEEQTVAAWRGLSPANERHYRELRLILDAARRGYRLVATEPPPALDVLEAAARRKLGPSRRLLKGRRLGWGLGLAAVTLLAVGLGWVVRGGGPGSFGIVELTTGASETTTVSLNDGTVVRVAPGSKLRFGRGSEDRVVDLTGRAYFAVSTLPGRPFRVRTTAGELTVLGTRFDVETRDDNLRLVVVEGRVSVADPQGGETRVSAGQLSRVVAGNVLPAVRIPDLASETKWVGRFLAFQSTPLVEVAREIERVYGVRVEVESALANRTITTWLSDRSLDEVIRIVCAVSVASCTNDRGVVSILGS